MQLNLQDILAIVAAILGPMGALIGFMWHHFNTRFEKVDQRFETHVPQIFVTLSLSRFINIVTLML